MADTRILDKFALVNAFFYVHYLGKWIRLLDYKAAGIAV